MTKQVVVPYPATNSSVRTRALHWIDRLVAARLLERDEVVVRGPGFSGRKVTTGDPVLLLRNASRFSRGGRERRMLASASPGVYDLDDGLPWDDGRLPGLGRWYKRPFARSLVAAAAADAADRVVVGNEVLAEWASQHCTDVRIVPTCVEPGDYERRSQWQISQPGPVLGWIGSRATEPYLAAISGALRAVVATTGARLEVISTPGPLPPEFQGFTTKSVWRPDSVRAIASWDVGLMPLRDGVYERAKCGYKLLQYAASGVPAVGSPVGVNRRLLDDMDGLAPVTEDDWVDALSTLVAENEDRRRERAERGFAVARAHSYEVWQAAWIDAVGWM
jgi:glycosyltransferase involved in cell wall biosynthesis